MISPALRPFCRQQHVSTITHMRAVHVADGNSATLKWITRLRLWESTRKTWRTRKVAVGTVKKSMEAVSPKRFRRKVLHV